MFTIKNNNDADFQTIEMANLKGDVQAKICLNQGGRLSSLKFSNTQVIAIMPHETYSNNYASSILFPFVNRIKDGKYFFNKKNYTLAINEVERNNALHGLVFNKTFALDDQEINQDYTSVKLSYTDKGLNSGFPFKFKIELNYKLTNDGLNLKITVINEDKSAFPFCVGWHPYFISEDLYNSYLHFNCDKKLVLDDQFIPTGYNDFKTEMPFKIKNNKLDDGYLLKSNNINFITPKYKLEISSSHTENYLQVFTPEQENTIAIEPMTAVPNSFNNKIGLQILEPGEKYNIEWTLKFKENNKLVSEIY